LCSLLIGLLVFGLLWKFVVSLCGRARKVFVLGAADEDYDDDDIQPGGGRERAQLMQHAVRGGGGGPIETYGSGGCGGGSSSGSGGEGSKGSRRSTSRDSSRDTSNRGSRGSSRTNPPYESVLDSGDVSTSSASSRSSNHSSASASVRSPYASVIKRTAAAAAVDTRGAVGDSRSHAQEEPVAAPTPMSPAATQAASYTPVVDESIDDFDEDDLV
jgi:hypothetical protein